MSVLGVACGAALVQTDVELGGGASRAGGQVHAVDVAVVALGEDDAEEGFVELHEHLHAALLALDVQGDDLGHVSGRGSPQVVPLRGTMCLDEGVGSGWVPTAAATGREWWWRSMVGRGDGARVGVSKGLS